MRIKTNRKFKTGLPFIRPERTLQDALGDLGQAVGKKQDYLARNSHRRGLQMTGERPEETPEPVYSEDLRGQFRLPLSPSKVA